MWTSAEGAEGSLKRGQEDRAMLNADSASIVNNMDNILNFSTDCALTLMRPTGVLGYPSTASACVTFGVSNIFSRYFMNLSLGYRSLFGSTENRFCF